MIVKWNNRVDAHADKAPTQQRKRQFPRTDNNPRKQNVFPENKMHSISMENYVYGR